MNSFEYAKFLQVKIGCKFAFEQFPFDKHVCDFKLFSPSYDKFSLNFEEVLLYNSQTGQKVPNNETLALKTDRLSFKVSAKVLENPKMIAVTGYEYNVQGIKLYLERSDITLLLSAYFIPTGLFTFFSLLSFLVPINQVHK